MSEASPAYEVVRSRWCYNHSVTLSKIQVSWSYSQSVITFSLSTSQKTQCGEKRNPGTYQYIRWGETFKVETRKCVIIFLLKSSRDCGKRGIINNEEESSSYQMSSLLMEEPRGSVGMKVYVGYVYV